MTKRALCIGINDYPGTGSDLAGCVNDANDWGDALQGRGFEVTHAARRRRHQGHTWPRRSASSSAAPGPATRS